MGQAVNVYRGLIASAVNESPEAIVIADMRKQDFPLAYVNRGFEMLTGYANGEVIGRSFHFLRGEDDGQPDEGAIQAAVSSGESCVVTLRNYRKDGVMFWCESSLSPVKDMETASTHFMGIQRDVTARILLEQRLITSNPLVGVSNRSHFNQRFADALVYTRRTHSGMSLFKIELDFFEQYVEQYGQMAGDECLQNVGDCIAGLFVRTSDCVAHYGGGDFAVVSLSFGAGALRQHAQKLCGRVRTLGIPHNGSPHGVVTVSIGGVHCMPTQGTSEEMLASVASSKLQVVKRNGCNGALIIG